MTHSAEMQKALPDGAFQPIGNTSTYTLTPTPAPKRSKQVSNLTPTGSAKQNARTVAIVQLPSRTIAC